MTGIGGVVFRKTATRPHRLMPNGAGFGSAPALISEKVQA
jgi:hypothetical protein